MFHHHWRERAAEVGFVLSAKDFLAFALTDARVTDPSTAAGYAAYVLADGAFSSALCRRWGLPMSALPAVAAAHSAAGTLTAAGARLLGLSPGIPVSVGAADSVAGAYALTGLAEGAVSIAMGSSTIILDAINEPRVDPRARFLLTPHVIPGWYGREMDLLATGTGYAWLSGLFGWQAGELDERAATSTAGARGLVFRPYLAGGEQGALWDPTLTGSIRGLGLRHGPADIARALLEGINFEIRRCLEVLGETSATRRVVVSGQIVDRPASLQMLSDVLGCPLEISRLGSPAAVGAALGARSLAGLSDPPGATRRKVELVVPGPDAVLYRQLYSAYLAAQA
jgi:xylulokinase